MMSPKLDVAAFFIIAWLGGSMGSRADGIVIEPIHIVQDTGEAIVRGAVVRGERALYAIDAQAGQRLTLSIAAIERNAVFQLYAPGARPERRDYGLEIVGEALAGAAEGDDATRWVGTLERTGAYLVAVGPTRGNATFSLTIEVH
jgi:hypothetical protein